MPLARSHRELIAGGLAVFLEGGIARDATILSAIPAGSFAGIALTLVPWLLSGGTLALHHGFDPAVFAEQTQSVRPRRRGAARPGAGAARRSGPARRHDQDDPRRCGARPSDSPPSRHGKAKPRLWTSRASAKSACCRLGADPTARPAPLPHGAVSVPRGAAEAIAVVETAAQQVGQLVLRGPMVPTQPFPPATEQGGDTRFAPDGFLDTGYACKIAPDGGTLTLTAPPAGITATGFYRFRQSEVDAVVAAADPAAVIVALPDGQLGQRLAGRARDGAAITAALEAYGVNALIAGAFRPRGIAA